MSIIKITPTLLNEKLEFEPIKYFVSKHSIYPNVTSFYIENIDVNDLFESLKDKFYEFQFFSSVKQYDQTIKYDFFCLIFEEKSSCMIFYYDGTYLNFYSSDYDEGMNSILTTLINSCHEK